MSKKFKPLKKVGKGLYGIVDKLIVTPISTVVYHVRDRIGKDNKIEKILNRPNVLLYLSLAFAIVLFLFVDSRAMTYVNTEAEILPNQPVKVIYNSSAYVVEGIPDSVDITLIGKRSELYLARQLGNNEVVVDLTDYEASDTPIKVKMTYNKTISSLDYKLDPSYVMVTIKKKVSAIKNVSYDLMNQDLLDPKLSVKSVELSKSEVVVKGSQDTLDTIASIKALINLNNPEYKKAGTYNVENVQLVAYDSNGHIVNNVEIVSTNISATLVLDSYSKKVPVKVLTEGALVDGKAISSITINGKAASEYEVTIYGDENSLETIENIPVTLDIAGLGNSGSKTLNVSLPKPSGVRSIVDDSVSIVLNFGEAKQKTVKVVGIKTINVPSGLVANLASAEDINVDVQVIGVESVIDALGDNPTGITAYVDLSGCVVGGPYPIDVKVVGDDSRLQYVVTKKVNVVLSKSS
jgi:YbbR domain-containing protein